MDKVCAVFGGSRGIGRTVAQLMAKKGYRLAIVSRNLEVAKAAAGELGGNHMAFSCDVAKEQDVQNTFAEMEKHLGPVNFLVNAAGINRDSLLVRTKTEDMISLLHTNLLGSMLTCKAAMKTMIQQGGSIVNVEVFNRSMNGTELTDVPLSGVRQQEVICLIGRGLSKNETSKPTSTVTHFLQQGYTYSYTSAASNSATSFGTFFFQTTVNIAKTEVLPLNGEPQETKDCQDRDSYFSVAVTNTTTRSTYESSLAYGPQGYKSIMVGGSIIGLKGNVGQSVYSASKGGLVGFSRSLAKEVARKKIRVNVVAPGFIHTDMTKHLKEEHFKKNIPLGRFGDPLEVAHAVVFLLEAPYVTGHVLVVDGGLQLTI